MTDLTPRTPREKEIARWAYVAGLIDGEGSITATQNRTAGRGSCHAALRIGQREPQVIQWLLSELEDIGRYSYWSSKKDGRVRHGWACTKRENTRLVLESVLPFLTLKRAQAELALELADHNRPDLQRQKEIRKLLQGMKRRARNNPHLEF